MVVESWKIREDESSSLHHCKSMENSDKYIRPIRGWATRSLRMGGGGAGAHNFSIFFLIPSESGR